MFGIILTAVMLATGPQPAGTPQPFSFLRQFPPLQQPWYFVQPRCIAEDATGAFYVADTQNDLIRKFSRDGTLISQWGGQGSSETELSGPQCVVIGPDGHLYISDDEYVRVFNTDGEFIRRIGGFGNQCPGRFSVVGELDFDAQQRLYVLDSNNNRVQRFENLGVCMQDIPGYDPSDSENDPCVISLPNSCVTVWDGTATPGQPPLEGPRGLGIDSGDQLLITEHDASRVRQFDGDGNFIRMVGGPGAGAAQFNNPEGVSITDDDRIYVADFGNNRLQEFDPGGNFVREILGAQAETEVNFFFPISVTVTNNGEFYVTDNPGFRVLRFDPNGVLNANFGSGSRAPGRLTQPRGIDAAIDLTDPMMPERVFVADSDNDRINVYELDGRLARSFGMSTGVGGEFNQPGALAVNSSFLYVTNQFDFVDVFTLDGTLVDSWPDRGDPNPDPFLPNCTGRFGGDLGNGLAIDPMGNVYVTDTGNSRVLKFDPTGTCLLEIGVGVLDIPHGVAADGLGRVLVADSNIDNSVSRVVLFNAVDGLLLGEFGSTCPTTPCGPGEFEVPFGLAVDSDNLIYVTDGSVPFDPQQVTRHVQVFDPGGTFITGFGETGVGPGQFQQSLYTTLSESAARGPTTKVAYTSDFSLNRVVAHTSAPLVQNTRAIVVAGGGPFPGNVLWPATQANANFAVATLGTQGMTKSVVQYLSEDLDLDLDQNGLADDVDLTATNANLELSILGPGGAGTDGFAGDAAIDHLVLYLIDHGGQDTFRMSGTELLGAADLAGWIDTWHSAHPAARVTVVYDACQSGSFLNHLNGPDRTIITSSLGTESAYFVSGGTLSFSNFFWTQVFNGDSVKGAFDLAAAATSLTFPLQTPQMDTDLVADGNANTAADLAAVDMLSIGAGTDQFGQGPAVNAFTVTEGAMKLVNLNNGNTATLTADGVIDPDGVGRVWVVIQPPGFGQASPDNPVTDLPTVDLSDTGGGVFQAVYSGFNEVGSYILTLYVVDALGNAGAPLIEQVDVGNPLSRRVVVVTGGDPAEDDFPAWSLGNDLAFRAMDNQGYGPETCPMVTEGVCHTTCDSICYLTADTVTGRDASPDLTTLQQALTGWGVDPDGDMSADVQDLTLVLAAPPDGSGGLRLNATQSLTATQLATWLDAVQAMLPGTVSVVLDGDEAGSFLSAVGQQTTTDQILIGSASAGQQAVILQAGQISFSRFFWGQVFNGARTRSAFSLASSAIRFGPASPTPVLDDTGNGIHNELFDGLVANQYSIGAGILLAGDDPLIGSISAPDFIAGGTYPLTVSQVTSTGQIDGVVAVVSLTDGSIQETDLVDMGGGIYQATLTGLDDNGLAVPIAAYARDIEGNTSTPATTRALGQLIFASGFEPSP